MLLSNRNLYLFVTFCFVHVSNARYQNNQNWGTQNTNSNSNSNLYTCGKYYGQRIVGGEDAGADEFPWMVALMRPLTESGMKEVFCGGTIISPRFILTAAHCVSSNVVSGIWQITARVGNVNLSRANQFQRDYAISGFVRHQNYQAAPSLHNDIAVLMTQSPISWSQRVRAICLPFRNSGSFEYSDAIVTGWGALGMGNRNSNNLKKVSTIVKPNHVCNSNPNNRHTFIESELCTYLPRKDSCSSDSGGPVISAGSRKFLIGIVSGGGLCGMSPGVNVRVTSYLNWIRTTVRSIDPGAYFEEYSM